MKLLYRILNKLPSSRLSELNKALECVLFSEKGTNLHLILKALPSKWIYNISRVVVDILISRYKADISENIKKRN